MKFIVTGLLMALSSATLSAQQIDVEIRNRQILNATQFRYEVWEKAGAGYVRGADGLAYNPTTNPIPNGGWTGQQIRYVFTLPIGVSIASATIQRNGATTISAGSSVQGVGGTQLSVSAGRSSDGIVDDLGTNYVRIYTVTVNTTGGTLTTANTATLNLTVASNLTFWSNAYNPGQERPLFNPITTTPLPLQLTDFTATKEGPQLGRLKWFTAQEKGMDHFEVERSADGRYFSTKIGAATAGNTADKAEYTLLDKAPLPGDNYYRLKMVEQDGKVSYSEVRKLNFDRSGFGSVTVLKNPFANATEVRITADAAQTATYLVTDAGGKTIISGNWDVASGDNLYTVDLGSLASGTYMLAVKGASVSGQVKLLKVQ